MSTLVESLNRLYGRGSKVCTKEKLKSMVEKEEITAEDYEYITGEPYSTKNK